MCVNEIQAMYERPRVNVKVERGSTFTYTPDLVTFDTLSLFYLRAYARKKYATVEIHLKAVRGNPTAHDIPRLTNSYKYLRQTFVYSHRRH